MFYKFGKLKNISLKILWKNRLFKNMSWLFILNFSNAIIPYFTFPYITRIFLPQGYGVISFSLSFILYFQILIDYGFDLTGAKKIAIIEANIKELSKIYTSIISTKFLFFLVTIPIIVVVTLLNTKLYKYHEIIFIFILLLLSNVLMPTWFFQGLQKVRYMTIISLSVRVVFLIFVFTLIKSPADIMLYAILYATSFLIIGVISMIIIRTQIKIRFCRITFRDILNMIKDGFYVFLSNSVIKVTGSTGIFVLGLFHPVEYSGYYSGISKINQGVLLFFYPVGRALFPYYSKKYTISFKNGYSSVLRIAKMILPIFIFFAIGIILLRKQIVLLVLGSHYLSVANLLVIMAFLPLLSIISNFMGTQILVASGHTKEYSRAFIRGSLILILLYFILGYFFLLWGVALAALLGAIINLLFLLIEILAIKRQKI
jgi:polysaccharide transporter, PST family